MSGTLWGVRDPKIPFNQRDAVHFGSMSSLHMPTSMIEIQIRRDKFGEGVLAVTQEGLLGDSAGQKYSHLQKKVVADLQAKPRAPPTPPPVRNIKTCTPSAAMLPFGVGLKHPPDTLHGNLGTGNSLSHYLPKRKYSDVDRTPAVRFVGRLTTEEREIVRAFVQYTVRNRPKFDRIWLENAIIADMIADPKLKSKFLSHEEFSINMLESICVEIEKEAAANAKRASK